MKRKKYAPILIFLLLAVSLFGLWQWIGEGLPLRSAPKVGADGKADYAGYLNGKLDKMPSYEREAFLYSYVGSLNAQNLEDIFAQQQTLKADNRELVMSIVALRWGEVAPQAGWKAMSDTIPFPEKAARALLAGWAVKDFAAARQAVEQMGNVDRRNKLAGELFKARAKVNPEEAARACIAEIYKKKDPGLIDTLQLWADTDRPAALAFALENERAGKLRGIFTNWLSQDPEAAMASLAAMQPKQRDDAVGAILVNDFFMRFNPKEVRALLTKFPSPDAKKQRERYARFFRNRMSVAPSETINEMMALPDRELQAKVLSSAVSELASFDTASALEVLKAWMPSASDKERNDVFSSTLWTLTRNDAIGTLMLVKEMPVDRDSDRWKADIMDSIPPAEFEKAQKLIEKMDFQENHMRAYAIGQLAGCIYEKNPKLAFEWMNRIEDKEAKSKIAGEILQKCAAKDIQQALELYQQFSQEQKLEVQAYNLLNRVEEIPDPQATLLWAQKNVSGYERNSVISRLVELVARKDIAQGIALIGQIPEGNTKEAVVKTLVERLSERSPDEAMQMIEKLGDPDLQKEMRSQLLINNLKGDFPTALQMLRNPEVVDMITAQAEDQWRNESTLMNSLVYSDPEQVRAVIDTLPDGQREKMLSVYASSIFETDPRQSLEILAELGVGANKPGVFLNSFSSWASIDAGTAMQWLDGKFEGDLDQRHAYGCGISEWLEQDIAGASQWIADYPSGDMKDAMASSLVYKEAKNDPEGAFVWAMSVQNESMRTGSLQYAFAQWQKTDPQAAQAALEHADLTPQEKAILKNAAISHE